MTDSDAVRFARVMLALRQVFPQRELDEHQVDAQTELYFGALADLSIDVLERGAAEAIRTCRFFPKPAELRECAYDAMPETPRVPPARRLGFNPHSPSGREAVHLVGAILAGRMTPAQRLAAFRQMAERYPGAGWEACVEEYERRVGDRAA